MLLNHLFASETAPYFMQSWATRHHWPTVTVTRIEIAHAHRNRTRASKSHTRIEIAHAPGVHRNRTRAPTSHTHRVCVLHVLATRLYLQSNRKVVQESTNRSPTFCETSCETLATNPFFERIRRNGRERHENAKGANTAYQRPFFRVSRIMCIS